MKRLFLIFLCANTMVVMAESCLQTDKKGTVGSSSYYDYGRCKSTAGAANNGYGSVNAIGQVMAGILSRTDSGDSSDRGYSDAQRNKVRREIEQLQADFDARRAFVKIGATVELNRQENLKISQWQYQNASLTEAQIQAIRTEIAMAIGSGKLLDLYGQQSYHDPKNPATWGSPDPVTRWKSCEVATQLSRAYAFGDFIKPEQMDATRGLAIARTGYAQHCGGTAYWLGRMYEEGDVRFPGVDKRDLGEDVRETFTNVYDMAILNGYTPAYERMAELYRESGPARFQGKSISFFNSDLYWPLSPKDDAMFMMKVQYSKCLEAEPANLVCAKGLRAAYSDKTKNFGYTNYNEIQAAFYEKYVKKLEELLAQAGLPAPANN